jgi:arachidonate 15-lipoxygenase
MRRGLFDNRSSLHKRSHGMSSFLPHQDQDPDSRALGLEKSRLEYQYNYSYVSPLAMVDQVPLQDEFSWKWLVQCGEHALTMLANHIEVDGDLERQAALRKRHGLFNDLVHAVTADFKGVIDVIEETLGATCNGDDNVTVLDCVIDVIEETLGATPINGPLKDLEAFHQLFRTIGLPAINKDYTDDGVFSEMRVAGTNPLLLRKVPKLDERFPVTDLQLHGTLPGDSLAAAGAEGRLYLVDYAMLKGVENGLFAGAQKYLHAPLAAFVFDPKSRKLVPVAIQCGQEPGPDAPIFTPRDGHGWLIAKPIVEVADGNYHEAVSHLGRTHLFIKPFVIASARQLAANHPVGMLPRPHFEGTLKINDYARRHLVNDSGPVDKMLAGAIGSTRGLTVKGVMNYRFNESILPTALAARGVDDPTLLPHYPYRDDALLYWNAIRKWVADYLAIYYVTDGDLQADAELNA